MILRAACSITSILIVSLSQYHFLLCCKPCDAFYRGQNQNQNRVLSTIKSSGTTAFVSHIHNGLLLRQNNPIHHKTLFSTSSFSSTSKLQEKPNDGSTTELKNNEYQEYQEGSSQLFMNTESTNDTIAINTVGSALNKDQQLSAAKSKAVSEQLLMIDPSTIEVVPFSELAKEGEVFGGPSLDPSQVMIVQQQQPSSINGSSIQNNNKQPLTAPLNFVSMFRGSANYIANHRNTIVVYHIPGDLISWDGFKPLMDDIALTWLLGVKPVIVIGCRKQIEDRLTEMECDISSNNFKATLDSSGFHLNCFEKDDDEADDDGIYRYESVRVTDYETLRVVKEEAGFVRFEVERQLARALHMHGTLDHDACRDGNVVSGNFYSAQPYGVIDGVDFMYTGYPRRFEVEKIHQILNANDVVLLTPLGASPSGEIFNVNAEHLAACAAGALKASKIIYFTKNGTAFRETTTNKLVQNFKLSDAKSLLQYNNVAMDNSKGFTLIEHKMNLSEDVVEAFVKTGWSIAALEKGVKRAHIIAPINGALLQELYTRDGSGTLISRDIYEGIRNANVNDVAGIYELIEPLIKSGYLVDRPKNVLEKDIESYYVFTRDGLIIASAQLKLFENGFAEIGCMVVKKEYRNQGRGDAMLCFLERLSVMCECPNVFVLSTQTMEWFIEHGYSPVDVDELPPSRKAVYNYQRKSKIYMKKIENIRDLDASELWWNR